MSAARLVPAALALGVLFAPAARAQTIAVNVTSVTAAPGATVDVPVTVSPGPEGLGILGIQLRMELGAAVVQSSSFVSSSGWLWWWGAPAQNAGSIFAAAAAAGVAPVGAGGGTLATLRIVVRPDAIVGTDLPLTLSTMAFNEGSPAASVTNGLLRVRTGGVDAPGPDARDVALSAPAPNPARTPVRLGFTLARAEPRARLDVLALDGRLVRVLGDGAASAGRHDHVWDLRDGAGEPVPPGLYFARLQAAGATRTRRLAVLR